MENEITLRFGLILEIQEPGECSTQVVVHVHDEGFDTQHVRQTDGGGWEITSLGGCMFEEKVLRIVGCVSPQVFLQMYADYLGQTLEEVEERMGEYLDEVKDKRRKVMIDVEEEND